MTISGFAGRPRVFAALFGVVSLTAVACAGSGSGVPPAETSSDYGPPVQVGTIRTDEVKESSGLAASKCQPNVLWTHNDAGKDAFVYALSPEGQHLGTWRVPNARNVDWEDLAAFKDAAGKCYLLVGDIGDNSGSRDELTVYRVPEPMIAPDAGASSTTSPISTEPADALRFSYSDTRNNAETLLAHPRTGDIYVVTKKNKGPASVYKIKGVFEGTGVIRGEKLGELSMPADPAGRLTGGSYSPDGTRIILCDLQNGYELKLPDSASDPDLIWKQKPSVVDLGERKQGEAVSYSADGNSIFASSEKKNAPLFRINRK